MQLQLHSETLECIKIKNGGDHVTCLREMLKSRLQTIGSLTWRHLCACLRSSTVARKNVAAEIEEQITGVLLQKVY